MSSRDEKLPLSQQRNLWGIVRVRLKASSGILNRNIPRSTPRLKRQGESSTSSIDDIYLGGKLPDDPFQSGPVQVDILTPRRACSLSARTSQVPCINKVSLCLPLGSALHESIDCATASAQSQDSTLLLARRTSSVSLVDEDDGATHPCGSPPESNSSFHTCEMDASEEENTEDMLNQHDCDFISEWRNSSASGRHSLLARWGSLIPGEHYHGATQNEEECAQKLSFIENLRLFFAGDSHSRSRHSFMSISGGVKMPGRFDALPSQERRNIDTVRETLPTSQQCRHSDPGPPTELEKKFTATMLHRISPLFINAARIAHTRRPGRASVPPHCVHAHS
ncbi:hypothetical protein BU17DRAFT_96389 [Hysterangium stoloniferum]|nr:hypothetical protein BU17DRAFT_96389 [Hysterangium stoloniferum]